jgi:hypothetical protein
MLMVIPQGSLGHPRQSSGSSRRSGCPRLSFIRRCSDFRSDGVVVMDLDRARLDRDWRCLRRLSVIGYPSHPSSFRIRNLLSHLQNPGHTSTAHPCMG